MDTLFKCAFMSKAMTSLSVLVTFLSCPRWKKRLQTVCLCRLLLKLGPNTICIPCETYSKYTTLHIENPIKDVATNHKDVATITILERESKQNNARSPHVIITHENIDGPKEREG